MGLGAALMGCGDSSEESAAAGAAGGGAGGSGGATAGPGGQGGAGDGGAGGSGGAGEERSGVIFAYNLNVGQIVQSGAGAEFRLGAPGSEIACTVSSEAGCEITVCDASKPGNGGGPVEQMSAGTISIAGGLRPITLDYDYGEDRYEDSGATAPEPAFNGGEMLTLSAAGDEVPMFDTTFAAPSHVTVTEPDFNAMGSFDVSLSNDLAIAWTGGTVEDVTALLDAEEGLLRVMALCTWPASAGGGNIPTAVLGNFSAGMSGVLSINGTMTTTVQSGDWPITITITDAAATDSTMLTAFGGVSFL